MSNDIAVVIPTYNERDNIVKLIGEINRLTLPIDILVVDDDSPDGTGKEVEAIIKNTPNISIIHRNSKAGLGPAYIEGFRKILKTGQYRYILHMDADFSHDPKYIPKFLDMAKQCDVVLGSRYVEGGGVSDVWGSLRKFLSRFGNAYARLIMGLKFKDCTGGFRCYSKEALGSVKFNKKFLNGYGFLVQMLYEVNKNNLKICEIPIFFAERTKGKSKMDAAIMAEAFFSLLLMKLKDIFTKK